MRRGQTGNLSVIQRLIHNTLKIDEKLTRTLDPVKRKITFGSYEDWPKGAQEAKSAINIKTDVNCVEYSMITHFAFKTNTLTVKSSKYKIDLQKFCRKNRGKCFKFPSKVK